MLDIKKMGLPNPFGQRAKGFAFAGFAILVATGLAVPLELMLTNANLVLIYVLSVIVTGLNFGSTPAITASILASLSFNFFLTEPRYTFHVIHQDDVATLIFLFLIALICGPVASRIHRQFALLKETNNYSEAMRFLGQQLSVAEDIPAVWQALNKVIGITFRVDCCIVSADGNECHQCGPKSCSAFASENFAALESTGKEPWRSGQLTDTLDGSVWSIFPINMEGRCVAAAIVRLGAETKVLPPNDRTLMEAILQQGADTLRRIQLAGELESARIQAEVEQLRSALLSSVSHDLKSPLSAMMGAAESLRVLDKQLNTQDRHELAETILQESYRLDSYIQNLLDMTRLGYGDLKIERDWVSVEDIIGAALSRLRRYFPKVNIDCQVKAPPTLIYVHAALLEQALFNILENAARFSPSDEAIVVRGVEQMGACIIEIEDKGPGIPESLREQVFDMFYVVSEGDGRKQSTGMGLAICRGMVGAHGGTVHVSDGAGGRGTRFVVKLPIDHSTEAAIDNADSEGHQ